MACSAELRIARLVGQSVLFRVQLITTYSRQLHCPRTLVHFNDHMPNECKLNQSVDHLLFLHFRRIYAALHCDGSVGDAHLTGLEISGIAWCVKVTIQSVRADGSTAEGQAYWYACTSGLKEIHWTVQVSTEGVEHRHGREKQGAGRMPLLAIVPLEISY